MGWSTIATGVGPEKHGVNGFKLNMDPGQATKNGYLDFLDRAQRSRPSLSTFLASDWANIGLHQNGGPIFADSGTDARYSLAAEDTIDSYDTGDQAGTDVAARYLVTANPDAGFVYLGVVDETAHAVGSATPDYPAAIARTDTRIGQMLGAIRSRPNYGAERWTVIVTTDHGQQNFNFGSIASHGGGTELERTSFVIAAGPGIPGSLANRTPGVVDINPTVQHQLGLSSPRIAEPERQLLRRRAGAVAAAVAAGHPAAAQGQAEARHGRAGA